MSSIPDWTENIIGPKKIRHVRIETELWVQACRKAASEGLTISSVVRRLLTAYVSEGDSPLPG